MFSQYKFKYNNGEKCVKSCSDIKIFLYKSNCVEKCPDNTFLDESNFICFDVCKDNIYNNKTFNFKKTCVDFDPNLYSDIESEAIQYEYSSEMMNGNKIISDIKDSWEEEKEYESFKTDETDFYEKTNDCGKFTEETANNQICQYSYKPDDCPENCPFINIQNNLCVNNCDIVNFFNHSCNLNNPSLKLHQNFKNNISKMISSNSINNLLDIFAKNEEDLIVNNKNFKYQITSTKNQKEKIYDDISTIDLGECENILREKYDINTNISLIISKVDYLINISQIPFVSYEVYNPYTNEKLNLSYCKNVINVAYPVKINEDELYKHNPSDEFYSDICSTYTSEYNTDVTLEGRKKEFINNNLSLCEEDCQFNSYDKESKKVTCKCSIKISFPIFEEIKINQDKLKKQFMKVINIKIVKCYKLILSKEGIIKNIGCYILSSTILINIALNFIFCLKDHKNIYSKINQLKNNAKKNVIYINNNNNRINNNNLPNLKSVRENKNKKLKKNKKRTKGLLIKTNKNSPPKRRNKNNNNIIAQTSKKTFRKN